MAFAVLIFSYILGSIPGAVLVGSLKGVKITEKGSTNPGTANVLRVLGTKEAVLCLLIDAGKGFLAVLIGSIWGYGLLACGAVIFGHNWSIFLRGKGGKGLATLAGGLLGITPVVLPLLIIIYLIINLITSYISLSTVLTGLFLPVILFWQIGSDGIFLGIVILIMVAIKHWRDLKAVRRGEEEKKNIVLKLFRKGR